MSPIEAKTSLEDSPEWIAGCLDTEQILEGAFQKCTENQFLIITLVKYFY